MSEENQKQPATITREELYRQVWETPMSRLGEQYGISGNGLKKICDRLEVPYPRRGYWAKLSVGKTVTQTPLPKPPTGTPLQVTISPTPPATAVRAPELDPETAERLPRGKRQNHRRNRPCHAAAAASQFAVSLLSSARGPMPFNTTGDRLWSRNRFLWLPVARNCRARRFC